MWIQVLRNRVRSQSDIKRAVKQLKERAFLDWNNKYDHIAVWETWHSEWPSKDFPFSFVALFPMEAEVPEGRMVYVAFVKQSCRQTLVW
jgi:hypothetical protein